MGPQLVNCPFCFVGRETPLDCFLKLLIFQMEKLGTIKLTVFLLLFLTLATKYYNREINKIIGLQKGELIITKY